MRKYAVAFKPSAKKDFERLPKKERQSAAARIDSLANNPRPHWAEMTTGDLRGLWKFRVGDFRVAYLIEDEQHKEETSWQLPVANSWLKKSGRK